MMNLLSSRTARMGLLALGLTIVSTLAGCVGQSEYDRLYTTNRSLAARNAELETQANELKRQVELMRGNIGSSAGTLSDLQSQNSELKRQLDQALADYKTLEEKLGQLQFGMLDPVTNQQLETLAAQYPDLIKYDAARGMLRFAADLTFDSGSDVVKANAKNALGALANVLKSSSAAQYIVVVEGHTDSQRISANTAKRHPTNRYLSAHRAISVIDELKNMGVSPARMMAAGWGEFRPLVPNTPSGNTPANRRVEIYLARDHSTGSTTTEEAAPAPTPTDATPDKDAPPARPADMSK